MKMQLIVLGLLAPSVALAGSDSRDCQTADTSVVMGAGNSTNRVQIKVKDAKGKLDTFDAPVMIKPRYGYNSDGAADDLVIAVPVSSEKIVSTNHRQLHVTKKTGKSCDGRESWDDRSTQTYILMAKDGNPLIRILGDAKPLKGLTSDGYVVVEMSCREYGITSPGGCHVEDGDATEWRPAKF
jgi:hypothetical protein